MYGGYEWFSFAPHYQYANRIEGYGVSGSVFSFQHGGYLIGVTLYGRDTVFYCREDMLTELSAYLCGESGRFVFRSPVEDSRNWLSTDIYSDLPATLAETLLSAENTETLDCDVTLLKNLPKWELRFHDKSGMLTTHIGTVYLLDDGTYGFLNCHTLDNTHFTADGYFSYRHGIVTLTKPSDETVQEMMACMEESYYAQTNYTYEEAYGEDYYENLKDSFWVLLVFAGYLLPIAPLVIGLVFANSEKMGRKQRWYLMAGMAALWLLLAVVLTAILLI